MVRRRARGYSLIEISVTLALFGIFLFIVVSLTAEMRRNEKRWPINFMAHPDISAVVSRLRRDVYDSKYFPDAWQSYSQSDQTPIIYTITPAGAETVVWDFRTPGQVTRHAWTSNHPQADWTARGVSIFTEAAYDVIGPIKERSDLNVSGCESSALKSTRRQSSASFASA